MAAIFAEATKVEDVVRHPLARREGLTLEQLQAIGTEAGIPAVHIAEAARALDRGEHSFVRRMLGLPVGVGRTVELGRTLTDAEWDRLVVGLRETFDARGTVRVDGSLRQWTNGNLQILLEPSENGDRLRMRTMNANLRSAVITGLAVLAAGGSLMALGLARSLLDPGAWAAIGFLTTVGAGFATWGALRLPGWARTRERQMAELAHRLLGNAPETPR